MTALIIKSSWESEKNFLLFLMRFFMFSSFFFNLMFVVKWIIKCHHRKLVFFYHSSSHWHILTSERVILLIAQFSVQLEWEKNLKCSDAARHICILNTFWALSFHFSSQDHHHNYQLIRNQRKINEGSVRNCLQNHFI